MKFFKKSNKSETAEVPSQEQNIDFDKLTPKDTEAEPTQNSQESNTGTVVSEAKSTKPTIDINDPATQQLIRKEARRIRLNEQILTEPHLARLEESLRLNETKMENIEENLARSRKQQERLHRYQELTMELGEQKKHLYEVNKQMAASIDDRETLQRFEVFENVQGRFQRLTTLEELRRQQKQRMSDLARDLESGSVALDSEQKRVNQLQDEMREASERFKVGLDAVMQAQQIESRNNYLQILLQRLTERKTTKNNAQIALEKEIAEQKHNIESQNSKTEAIRTRRQSLQPHMRMALHGELVLERLNRLQELKNELARIESQQASCQRKQTDENEMLGRVYSDYQLVEQKIQALTDELRVHRENNHGLESYRLQERAMQFKLRREMLISAQSLWTRIANGYVMIEDGMQAINAMRLKKESLNEKINTLEKELNILRRTCHEKEYTFTLSKSQNVIQLRSDLKEGTSCTVCGATHHPYHSDTMLEQNKLIGEIKMEYEAMTNELRAKEQLFKEMMLEEAAVAAKKEEAENTLITLRELQNGYVRDWQMFSQLDRSFAECDSSTNAPARTAMLRQLIENIGMDVEKAQKELDTFNFHQSRINELTEQIAIQEQRKNELVARLNEVNTGCQVIAGQMERIVTMRQTTNDAYSRMFEVLDKMITIPDWLNIWKRSHEALSMRIQEVTKEWNEIIQKLEQADHERAIEEMKLEQMEQLFEVQKAELSQIDDDRQDYNNTVEEGNKKLDRLIGQESSKQRMKTHVEELQECRNRLDVQQEKMLQAAMNERDLTGRKLENTEQGNILDTRVAAERQGVDVWMRQYNASHSPVQYGELEEIFGTDRNWNAIRETLRSLEMESLLTQSRVDKLNSQLVALQAEGSISNTDIDMAQHQLVTQIETLERRRREAMLSIATLTQQINAHQKAQAQIKEEKMMEN